MKKLKNIVLPVVSLLALSSMTVNAQSSFDANSMTRSSVQANPLNPGIIIKYKSIGLNSRIDSVTRANQLSAELGVNLEFKRAMSGGADVLILKPSANSFGRSTAPNLNTLVEQLNARVDVEFAEVDAWIVPYATPNDTAYNTQWHYYEAAGGMNLPTAWDTTTGSSGVTVAVLDTGYRPHADLAGNVIGQYDMISSTAVSVDGDGRDANAQDPGDFIAAGDCGVGSDASDSSWHGTHVAGTIAAVSNNNSDVAGVAWDVGLVPVRVLGKCGGSLSDIADGIRWAAGLSVTGVPANPNPADVINMSLGSGSPGTCTSTYQDAIDAAVNAGATVVVAAGNSNDTANYPPGNCNNVITVAATNRNGGRAYYSNFGSAVDVAAPGGDGCNPIGEGIPTTLSDCEGGVWSDANMIQSTYNTGASTPAADSIGALQGTSMAAPHVAGLAALMYSVKPTATPAEIESTMKSSARAFPTVGSHQCTTANCGAGIVDSNAAVLAIGGTTPPPTNNVLINGVAKTGLSGSTGSATAYTMVVPTGATNLNFALSGGTGDADLYVKFGSAPTTSSYDCRSWASGNAETCNIASAQAGTYHVLIQAYAAYSGASLTGSYTAAAANVAPTASFTSSCTDLTCSFNGSASSDSDGTISSYSWSFGGTGVTASNAFASAGTYSVTLTVTDNDGATGTSTQNVTVTAAPVNVAPTASFTSSCTDLTCSFDGSASSDSDGIISSYSWSFGGTGVTASNAFASAGTYSVTLTVTDNNGATGTSTQNISVTAPPPPTGNVLTNGVAKTGLAGSTGSQLNFTMVVAAGASNLKFVMSGGTGDADLYVRFGSAPTTSNYDCRSWVTGNNETCTITTAQAGTYYVMINAYSAYSGASLTGSYTTGGGTQQSLFSNTTNVNIPDNNATGATSSVSVNRTGASNSVKITYNIVHTYIGDLKVQLIDPTGAVSTLRSNTGGSANNINESKTVNKGSTSATGTWKLKVIDSAGADTGYINSWSIEFL